MARPASTDFLHSMRFHVTTDGSPLTGIPDALRPEMSAANTPAGFMSCTTPEATTESVEYREGHFNYSQKYPGNTTVNEVTLQKGVTPMNSNFWNWLKVVIEGSGNYRTDVTIKHFNRSVLTGSAPLTGQATGGTGSPRSRANQTDAVASRTYTLYEAFPIRVKVAGDLDATSSDISVTELDIAYEYFSVEDTDVEIIRN